MKLLKISLLVMFSFLIMAPSWVGGRKIGSYHKIEVKDDATIGGDIVLEGATSDAYETTFDITDPTADRTWTIDDVSADFSSTTDGYVFTYDTGTETWSGEASGGGSGWTDDGTTIRLTTSTDNVGIGTTNTAYKLDVVGTFGVGTSSSGGDFLIDSTGNVGIGTAVPLTNLDIEGTTTSNKINLGGGLTAFVLNGVSLNGIVGATSQIATEMQYIALQHSNTAAAGSRFMLSRSRGTLASPLIVQNGDALAALDFAGYDGTDYVLGAQIDAEVDGTVAGNRIDSSMLFKTSNNSVLPIERMRIKSDGKIGIGTTSPVYGLDVVHTDGLGIGTSVAGDSLVVYTDGNVGIGSTVPIGKLDIAGNIAISGVIGGDNEILKMNGTTLNWEVDASGGATAYDDIGDPDAASSIDFDDGETVLWTFTEDGGTIFRIYNDDNALGSASWLLELDHASSSTANTEYIRCVENVDDVGNIVFQVGDDGDTTIDGDITAGGTIEGATITEGGTGVPNTGDNLSVFAATTSAQLYGVISDETGSAAGAPLLVFNQGPTIDSLTVSTTLITAPDTISDDEIDENETFEWTNLHTFGNNIGIGTAATAYSLDIVGTIGVGTVTSGADFKVYTDGNVGIGTAVPLSKLDVAGIIATTGNIKGEPKSWRFTIIDPLATQTEDNEICLIPSTDAALTVTKLSVTLDAAANEILGDLKYADTFIGLANAAVIETFDTSSGVRTDSAIANGAVPAGKAVYLSFDSAPNTAIKQACFEILWDYD